MIKHPDPKIEKYLELLTIVCAIGLLVLIAVEFFFELDPMQELVIQVIDLAILSVFGIELLYHVYYAEKKSKYLRTHWLDVVTVLPVVGVFRMAKLAEFSRLGRLARLEHAAKIAELARAEKELRAIKEVSGIEHVYKAFRVFWHEKMAFGHHDVVSMPFHVGTKKVHLSNKKKRIKEKAKKRAKEKVKKKIKKELKEE